MPWTDVCVSFALLNVHCCTGAAKTPYVDSSATVMANMILPLIFITPFFLSDNPPFDQEETVILDSSGAEILRGQVSTHTFNN